MNVWPSFARFAALGVGRAEAKATATARIFPTVILLSILGGVSGCGKSTGTGSRITDSSQIVVQPGRGVPKVCEIGMSFSEIKRATGEASKHGLYDRDLFSFKRLTQERFVLVPSLGVIGIPAQDDGVPMLTFYVQPYDSSTTVPGLIITRPFRGSLDNKLSFNNQTVSRKEVEAAFGPVTQELTNYAHFSSLPDKTQPFSFRGDKLHYPCLGLSFGLKGDTVTYFDVRKPQRF